MKSTHARTHSHTYTQQTYENTEKWGLDGRGIFLGGTDLVVVLPPKMKLVPGYD